jgi:integrase
LDALYVLAIHTGLRQGELLGLKWTDIDFTSGKLSVQRSLDADGTLQTDSLIHLHMAVTALAGISLMD